MFYEDFEIDKCILTAGRVVTEQDLDAFIHLSRLDNPLFADRDASREAGNPDRLVPAPFQLSLAMGLAQQAGIFDQVVAVLEFKNMKFIKSVFPGDELFLEAKAAYKRPTSNPKRGLTELEYVLKKQGDQPVMTATAVYLIRTRENTPG